MFLVDSHCHLDQLDLTPYAGKLEAALAFARTKNVGHFLCACITLEDLPNMIKVVQPYSQVSISIGLHPNEEVASEPTVEELIALAKDNKVIAIGETGLDYYRSVGDLEWQRTRFRRHIQAAIAVNKPLIIHSRQAKEDTLAIITEEDAGRVGGVLHCFTEDYAMALGAIACNFYISFSGIVTFPNAKALQEVVKQVPLERMLIETDAPYLAPVPFRGKLNEPAYVYYVAEKIAQLRNMTIEEIAEITTENFSRCFRGAKLNV